MFFIDTPIGLVITIISMLIAVAAQAGVKSAYAKYSKVRASSGLTGAEVARMMVRGTDVAVVESRGGKLSDHFDPRNNTIALSQEVFAGYSVAALGIAAHEAGHALQHKHGYAPIKLRNGILPVARLGSTMSFPMVLIGIFASIPLLIDLGIIFFMCALAFQLITLPVEFNASRRAIAILESGSYLRTPQESNGAKAVLRAAAMTYVAAVVVSLLQLLRLLMLANRRR